MSAKQEHRKRYNQKLEYISHFEKWLKQEPPMWKFIRWHRWKKQRPFFSTVVCKGDYNDLRRPPTIPSAESEGEK